MFSTYLLSDNIYCNNIISKNFHNVFINIGHSAGLKPETTVSCLETIGIGAIIGGSIYCSYKLYKIIQTKPPIEPFTPKPIEPVNFQNPGLKIFLEKKKKPPFETLVNEYDLAKTGQEFKSELEPDKITKAFLTDPYYYQQAAEIIQTDYDRFLLDDRRVKHHTLQLENKGYFLTFNEDITLINAKKDLEKLIEESEKFNLWKGLINMPGDTCHAIFSKACCRLFHGVDRDMFVKFLIHSIEGIRNSSVTIEFVLNMFEIYNLTKPLKNDGKEYNSVKTLIDSILFFIQKFK